MPSQAVKILYCNLNRTREAHDLFEEIARRSGADLMCCSEPNKTKARNQQEWNTDKEIDVVQWLTEGGKKQNCGAGFAWTELSGVGIYTCYFSPNATLDAFQNFLDELGANLSQQPLESIVIGDFNAWGTLWGSRWTDHRGDRILKWILRRSIGNRLCSALANP